MHFGEDKIYKYQYFLRVDEYYNWKPLSSILEQIFLKADSVISNNGFYRIPGNIDDINTNTNPKGLEIVLGNYLDLKKAV